jgi:acyl-CoA dehydrogenase
MGVTDDMLDQIFDFMVRDFSKYATELMMKPSNSDDQRELAKAILRSPVPNTERFNKIWDEVYSLKDAYKMKDQDF